MHLGTCGSDSLPELVGRAVVGWPGKTNIEPAYIEAGKPWQNSAGESFNGKFCDQCLNLKWFRNRIDAKIAIEGWRRHYNETIPHSSPAYLTSAEFKQVISTNRPEEAILQA